jgi:hypothetical protein
MGLPKTVLTTPLLENNLEILLVSIRKQPGGNCVVRFFHTIKPPTSIRTGSYLFRRDKGCYVDTIKFK